MSANCPGIRWADIVLLNGRRGFAHRDHSEYPFDPKKWLIVFADGGGGSEWATFEDVTKLREEFLGMPNEDHFPDRPLTLWQTIPHAFDERLTWDATWHLNGTCLYCDLKGYAPVHTNRADFTEGCPGCTQLVKDNPTPGK
ncbi:hypothetical protein AB0M10_15160 [Streptomyces sp. NPDC051840]|uniref:hypothetical protein n=1 Tax=Streptomyces sp. NPDC051840 TaxID=3154752 RepID=UPI0034303899